MSYHLMNGKVMTNLHQKYFQTTGTLRLMNMKVDERDLPQEMPNDDVAQSEYEDGVEHILPEF